MSITVSISTVQTDAPDVDADATSNICRSLSLIPDYVGIDHPCCRKPHGSLRSLSLTGTIFLSIPSHFACIQSTRSQYFTSSNHILCGFNLNFLLKACFKSSSDLLLIGPRPWRHTTRLIVMHAVFRFFLEIFVYAAKQACKQLQCNKAKLLEPVSINGLHNIRVYARASLLSAYTNENLDGHIYTVTMKLLPCGAGECGHWLHYSLLTPPPPAEMNAGHTCTK